MYQYNNDSYHGYLTRGEGTSAYPQGPPGEVNGEIDSVEDSEDYFANRESNQYPSQYPDTDHHNGSQLDSSRQQQPSRDSGYHDYKKVQDNTAAEDVNGGMEDNDSDSVFTKKAPPKTAPKPMGYFRTANNPNKQRIFSRQDSSQYPYSLECLDHMKADQDLSPAPASHNNTQEHTTTSNKAYYTTARVLSNQSKYDFNDTEKDPFGPNHGIFSISNRENLNRDILGNKSTTSIQEPQDYNRSLYSPKSPDGSILINRENNSANGTLNHSTLSTRSTVSIREDRNMISSPSQGVYRVSSRNDVASSRGQFINPNRSILSNQSVHSHNYNVDGPDQNKSILSQTYSIDTVRTPTYKQNGTAHPVKETPLDATFRSNLNTSRNPSISLSKNNLYNQSKLINISAGLGMGESYAVHSSLVNLGLLCLVTLVLCVLGLQLIFHLNTKQFADIQETIGAKNLLLSSRSYENMLEVSTHWIGSVEKGIMSRGRGLFYIFTSRADSVFT